ncbi:MAG: hypothetical protein ISR64_04330 [Deltaproteobacteria bacterium]|nr:hypothetical protein [Deltaproteobacteria bacterium]
MRKFLATVSVVLLAAWTVTATHCLEEDRHDHQQVASDHGHDHSHPHPHRDGGKHEHACSCFHHMPGDACRPSAEPRRIQPSHQQLADAADWLLTGFPEDLLRPPRA